MLQVGLETPRAPVYQFDLLHLGRVHQVDTLEGHTSKTNSDLECSSPDTFAFER